MEKLKKEVTIVLLAIMMTMVFFANAQAKAGCNHKHTLLSATSSNCAISLKTYGRPVVPISSAP